MGLLDKVKAQATAATEMAKDAAAKGQAKMNDVQAKKAADGMLRDLGAAFYATKTGRSTPATDGEIAQLVTSLQAHESEHGQITLAPESAAAPPPRPRPATVRRLPPRRRPPRRPTRPPHHRRLPRRRRCRSVQAALSCPPGARGGGPAVHVGCPFRRGVEQSGSSSGS